MVLVETSVFTRQVSAALTDDVYRQLQAALAERPDLGSRIPGGGGLRKVQWAAPGRGKRGGVRVIYYWAVDRNLIVMLFLYPKNVQGDLSAHQLRVLGALSRRSTHDGAESEQDAAGGSQADERCAVR